MTKVSVTGSLLNLPDLGLTPSAPSFGAGIYLFNDIVYQRLASGVIGTLTNSGGTPGSVTSVSVLTSIPGLASAGSPITTNGTIVLSGTLTPGGGGTGIGAYTAGDMLYATGAQTLAKLAIGANDRALFSNGTAPYWGTLPAGATAWSLTGTLIHLTTSTNKVTVGGNTYIGKLGVIGDADEIQLRVRAHSSQSNYLASFEDSAGNQQVLISGNGDVIINEEGNDANFRVETDGNANALFVDGGSNNVGMGTATPDEDVMLDVVSTTKASRPFPTMNSTQRDAIATPATASVIYNSTTTQYEYWDGAAWTALSGGGSTPVADFCDFRLSLTSGVPVMTSNVTAATTLYAVPINIPYTEGLVTLKNGSTWETIASGEPSVALTGATASRPYDVFGYYDTGNMAIEILAWTNATTRATAISVEDGHPIKSGDATRRYIGTIRITGTTGQCEFSPLPSAAPSKLFVWNLMHQVPVPFRIFEPVDTYSYATATWRQANANANNQVEVVTGAVNSLIDIVLAVNAVATTSNAAIAMGEDSTTARATQNVGLIVSTTQVTAIAKFNKIVPLGYHYYAWLEIGNGSAVTWIGDSGVPDTIQSGFQGTFLC